MFGINFLKVGRSLAIVRRENKNPNQVADVVVVNARERWLHVRSGVVSGRAVPLGTMH